MAHRTLSGTAPSHRIPGFTLAVILAAGLIGFALGQMAPSTAAWAAPPAAPAGTAAPPAPLPAAAVPSDYSQRVVAYIYGSIPVTREDLGEYLIARQGLDKLELLVNKKIIEHACQKRGIEVTDGEVEAAIQQDVEAIKVNRADFINKVLKQYGKTLYEWKEDVIKPRLLLTKLCKEKIQIGDEDLKKAYEANHGQKIDCRIIIWPKGEERIALQEYDAVRKNEEGFDRKARSQANSALAATGGKIRPVARNSGVHPEVEQQAFGLQPGEVSRLIATPEGTLVLKVDKVLPPESNVAFEAVKDALYKEVYDKKVAQEIPNYFKTLKEEAKPVFILKKASTPQDLENEVKQELQQTGAIQPKKP